jgi:hypothetical protein
MDKALKEAIEGIYSVWSSLIKWIKEVIKTNLKTAGFQQDIGIWANDKLLNVLSDLGLTAQSYVERLDQLSKILEYKGKVVPLQESKFFFFFFFHFFF